MHGKHRHEHHDDQRNTHYLDERPHEDRQAAKELHEGGGPRRRFRKRCADLGEQLREAGRSPAELGPPVSHESEADDQAERNRHPLAPENLVSQLEHLELLERIAPIAGSSPFPELYRISMISAAHAPAASSLHSIRRR